MAIARALREDPEYPACLLVLDEPTATLPVDEVDHLLDRVSAMAATGVGVLYVTHHLGEVFRVAHKVSVFRDGVVVGAGPVKDFDHAGIVHTARRRGAARRGDASPGVQKAARAAARDTRPCSRSRTCAPVRWRACRFSVERGEIVGIAGLAGSGRDSVLGASFGALPRTAGEVKLAGEPLPAGRPDLAIGRGVAYLAPDRKVGGGVMTMSARENLTLPDLKPFWKGGAPAPTERRRARTKEWFERLSVRPGDAVDEPLSIFSGGNQQKILFGKWLSQKPSVFLLDEPTQGVDVGAKADLHRELVAAAEDGAAVVISSSDLEELADLCDRVLVIVDGRDQRGAPRAPS